MRAFAAASVVLLVTLALRAAGAEEPDPPSLELLEYLGSWQEQDAEWVGRTGSENAAGAERRGNDVDSEPRREPEDARDGE